MGLIKYFSTSSLKKPKSLSHSTFDMSFSQLPTSKQLSISSLPKPQLKLKLDHNPHPKFYNIRKSLQIENNLLLSINYPNCINYEGNKILLFLNTTLENLLTINQGQIDPHFSDNKNFISPFARFEPSPLGWSSAQQLAKSLTKIL